MELLPRIKYAECYGENCPGGGEVEPPRYFFTILTLPSSGDKILTEMAINLPCV